MNLANEDDKQRARSRSYLQLRSVRGCLSKQHSDGSHSKGVPDWWSRKCETGLIQVCAGSWWNKVVRTIPTRRPGKEPANVLGSLPTRYLKHITTWLYLTCLVYGRSLPVFSLSAGIDRSERMSFAARRWRNLLLLLLLFLLDLTATIPHSRRIVFVRQNVRSLEQVTCF